MDIRPLMPLPSAAAAASASTGSAGWEWANEDGPASTSSTSSSRLPPRWHLRTPTGGSINNSICIYPDLSPPSAAQAGPSSSSSLHKRARGEAVTARNGEPISRLWRRDDPSGRVDGEEGSLTNGPGSAMEVDGMHSRGNYYDDDGGDDLGAFSGHGDEKSALGIAKRSSEEGGGGGGAGVGTLAFGAVVSGATGPSREATSSSEEERARSTVRVLVSNNDQSVKAFRLQPPVGMGAGTSSSGAVIDSSARPFVSSSGTPPQASLTGGTASSSATSGFGERIEKSLPVISRTKTVKFPTCVNHSSFSPDGRHLVCVGDTPEVFLFHVDWPKGDLVEIATYTASSDASFSTSWSPDGLQFAVASQDGIVSVWDVRSSQKIATLTTSQDANHLSGAGAARVVKWSPRGDMLAYTEHQNYFHVVETTNFSAGQRIHVPLGTSGSSSSASRHPHHFAYGNGPPSSVHRGALPQSRPRSIGGNSIGDFVDLFGSLPRYSSSLRNSTTSSARTGRLGGAEPVGSTTATRNDGREGGDDGDDGTDERPRPALAASDMDRVSTPTRYEAAGGLGVGAAPAPRESPESGARRAAGPSARGSPATRTNHSPGSLTARDRDRERGPDRDRDRTGDGNRHESSWLMTEARLLAAARAGRFAAETDERLSATVSQTSASETATHSTGQTSITPGEEPSSGNDGTPPAFLARSVESIIQSLGASERERDVSPATAAASVRRAVMAAGDWPPSSSSANVRRDREALYQQLSSSAAGPPPAAADIDISGLAWDPLGEYLYVSTDCLVARYDVLDLRRSFGSADLL